MSNRRIIGSLPSVAATKHYLHAQGWETVGNSSKFTLFENIIGEEKLEVILTKSEDAEDREKTLFETINTLSMFFDRTFEQIVSEILSVRSDLFRSRIDDSLVSYDSIDLNVAVDFVKGLRALMVSSASAEINKKKTVRHAPLQAREYAGTCKFGHTFKGSFGFVVTSPIEMADHETIDFVSEQDGKPGFTDAPFGRKVVSRLARGFAALDEASAREDLTIITSQYEDGFNANMLDDLVSLHEAARLAKIHFDFSWSPELMNHLPPEQGEYELNRRKAEVAEAASYELRDRELYGSELVRGYVTDLHTDFDLRARDIFHDDRRIVIKIVDRGSYGRRLHVPLSEHDYEQALEAHYRGALVAVYGRMEKRGRYWYLRDPHGFQLMPLV